MQKKYDRSHDNGGRRCYSLTSMKNFYTEEYYTPYQLKLPLEISKIIDADDPVCTFSEVMDHIDLSKYFVEKGRRMGRPRCDAEILLKIILFAFMEGGYSSLRELEKRCKTDIRYMWLLNDMKAPSFMTFGNFIRHELKNSIDDIFREINSYIFASEGVDTAHVYIDGTKIEANANRYTWVWKKSCLKSREKVYEKLSALIRQINEEVLVYYGVKFEPREEYAIEYVELLLSRYGEITGIDRNALISGKRRRKSTEQKRYEELTEYCERLKKYAERIRICGEARNSYSKTDHDATFMRLKQDYMGNDQLLPAYNMQVAVCDEYIAVIDAKQYASDMDCFIPLMDKFNEMYGHYPKYPVADAGYGSYNNYLYCEEHGMEKYMKFTMYDKTVKKADYREDPFRAVNFKRNEDGQLICPNGKVFTHYADVPIRGNKYGRTEEKYICEDCTGCQYRQQCYKGKEDRRVIRLNQELTQFHKEVLENLECIHGALLRMNRSIQSEGTYGIIKWDRSYKRAFRRGLDYVILEFTMIACGFNLYKYHNKKMRLPSSAA